MTQKETTDYFIAAGKGERMTCDYFLKEISYEKLSHDQKKIALLSVKIANKAIAKAIQQSKKE